MKLNWQPEHTFSVQAQLGYSFAFGISKTYFSNGTSKTSSSAYIAIIPQVVTNYRFYYNLEKENEKVKIPEEIQVIILP
jgi:hypothetical protein